MNSIKSILLVVVGMFLISSINVSHSDMSTSDDMNECFNMIMTEIPTINSGQECYQISVNVADEPVLISDEVHEGVICLNSCEFIWCYEIEKFFDYDVKIICETEESSSCFQADGCIVIVGQ